MAIDEKSTIAIVAGERAQKRKDDGFDKSRTEGPFEPTAEDWQALHDAISSAVPSKDQEQFFENRLDQEIKRKVF